MSCFCDKKGQLCGEWTTKQRVAVYGSIFAVMGWAVYTGKIASDPPEQSPVLSKPSPESAAISAIFGGVWLRFTGANGSLRAESDAGTMGGGQLHSFTGRSAVQHHMRKSTVKMVRTVHEQRLRIQGAR